MGIIIRIVTFIILFTSFNLYTQEIEYQLYLKNSCNDSIEKASFYSLKFQNKEYNIENWDNPIIKVPKSGIYQLISKETNEVYEINISKNKNSDTLVSPTIYELVKPLSFKKNKGQESISKLNREESRTIYKRCENLLNGEHFEKFNNGKIRFTGIFDNGFAVGEIKEFYQNGIIKALLIYDEDGFLKKKIDYDKDGNEIKR